MNAFSRSLAISVALVVLMLGGCAVDLDERRLGFVSIGMTPSQVARVLGAPARTILWFESRGYFLVLEHGKLDGIGWMEPAGSAGGASPPKPADLGLRSDASATEVEAALGKAAKEEDWYYVNELYCFRVFFEDGRAIRKEKFDFPPI